MTGNTRVNVWPGNGQVCVLLLILLRSLIEVPVLALVLNWHKSAMKTNDKLHWNAHKFFKQEVKREIRLAERIYVKSQIINSKGNTNSIWKVINRCLPKKSSSLPQFNDSHENMANNFNKYFSSVGSLTALKADQLAKESCYLNFAVLVRLHLR